MADGLAEVLAAIARVEAKVDALIQALADDDGDEPSFTLDGHPAGAERDQGQSLG